MPTAPTVEVIGCVTAFSSETGTVTSGAENRLSNTV